MYRMSRAHEGSVPAKSTLATAVSFNLCLGILLILPFWLLVFYLRNWPLADLGITHRDVNENDGPGVLPTILLPLFLIFLAAWVGVNYMIGKSRDERGLGFWPYAALLTATPTMFLILLSTLI